MEKIINFGDVTKNKEHNSYWSLIPDHPYRILIVGDSGSGKINSLFSLITHQPITHQLLIKCFYMWKIHMKQSTNC